MVDSGGRARRPGRGPGRLRVFLLPRSDDGGLVASAPGVAPRELIRRFWPFARPYRLAIPAGVALVALLPAVQAAEIWMFKVVVDEVILPADLGALSWIAAVVLGLTLIGAALSFAEDYAWTWAGERFLLDLRATFFSHVQRLSFDTLDRRRLGDLIARLGGDIQAIESFVLGGLSEAISAVARIAFFAGALFLLDWQLALYALALAPPFYLAARHFARLARHAAREKRRRSGGLSAVAEESLAMPHWCSRWDAPSTSGCVCCGRARAWWTPSWRPRGSPASSPVWWHSWRWRECWWWSLSEPGPCKVDG
jgi:ATP-binding cassette, subfamily B, bacterial